MSQIKNILSKNKNLLIVAPLFMVITSNLYLASAGQEEKNYSNTLEVWHPFKNYLNVSVPQDILNQATPSGMTLGKVANTVEISYQEDERPLYIEDLIIANKEFKLPSSYSPSEDIKAREKFEEMKKDALKESIYLNAFSTYRSYAYQSQLYSRYAARDGIEKADKYSARAGHSEHQTGLAFDIGNNNSSTYASTRFNETKEAKWLFENAHKYGFILRYLKGKEDITGYMHESWHYRYVGTKWSTKIHESGLTLEEYLGLDKLDEVNDYL